MINKIESFGNLSHKQIKRIQEEAAEISQKNIEKEEKRKVEVKKAIAERDEYLNIKRLTDIGATYVKKSEIAPQVHGSKKPAGDNLPHGPRGGRFNSGKGLVKLR